MKPKLFLIVMIVLLGGCEQNQPLEAPAITATFPIERRSVWSIYHPDLDHPWNRVFRELYRRTSQDGLEYGADELDPLLWPDTTHLLKSSSHDPVIQLLDEFLVSHAEDLIRDPLRRAMFQRDLWAAFDWLASQAEPYPAQRRALETRLAQIIRRLALPKDEIASLLDNYAVAVESQKYPAGFQEDSPEAAFLPTDLFQPESGWVPLGRVGGPVALTHTEAFPFYGRSVFLVFVRSPGGKQATLDFIESLNAKPTPVIAIGSDVALARRMLLIDNQGEIIPSPLVETVQIRHFGSTQTFYEFELDRERLFNHQAGGLVPKNDLFMLFMGHGDVFDSPDIPDLRATIPEICKSCHFHDLPIPNATNTQSIISYARQPFPLPDNAKPVLFATTISDEAQTVIEWKHNHSTWNILEALWAQLDP